MKTTLLAALCLITVSSFAQITVDCSVRPMSKDTQPSFMVEIPQTTLAGIEKNWLKYTSEGSKGKATVVNGEHLQTGVVNTNICPRPFNVYSKLLETTQGVRLTAWVTENDTLFISKAVSADQDLALQKYIRDFAVAEYSNAVKAELKAGQEKQKELEKDLANLIKDEEKSTKRISESHRSIQKSNDNIAKNNTEIQNVTYKISDQKGMVERTASDPNANKGAKQTLKDLENERKKLQNHNETEGKNIDAMNKAIREEERNTALIKEKQGTKTAEIEQQKQKVKDIQVKLDGIK